MSKPDARVVAHYWTDACGKRVVEFGRKPPYSDAIPLTDFSLLAESESRITLLQDSIAAMLAERNAIQALADRWDAEVAKNGTYDSFDEGCNAARANDAAELRAALGGESPASDEVGK